MIQAKLVSQFFTENHHGRHSDNKVQIIDYCDANDQEQREDFWNLPFSPNTSEPDGLNSTRAQN